MKYIYKKNLKKLIIFIICEIIIFILLFIFFLNIKNILTGGWMLLFILGIVIPYLIGIEMTIKYVFRIYRWKKQELESLIREESILS